MSPHGERLIGDNSGVASEGCSESMHVPLEMLKRATKPFPLPGTSTVSKGGVSGMSVP